MEAAVHARYLIETPLEPARVAEVLAGEQSSGTFVRVAGETDELRQRSRALVEFIEELPPLEQPSLASAWLDRQRAQGPFRRARVTVAFPQDNLGSSLPTLAATVAGNLFDLGETTGVRLEHLTLSANYRQQFEGPRQGIAGTRRLSGVERGPILGTIIKPNVGLSAQATAELVAHLAESGLDFIKDDEVCANPAHAPLAQRVPAVMKVLRAHAQRTGRLPMYAFNISDDHEAMLRHAELVEREGGSCVMVSLNWVGLGSAQTLRRHTPLAIHGHRNGFGIFSRHPALGIDFQAWQTLYRLAGVDHLHVHGLQGKFSQPDEEVITSARACLQPLVVGAGSDDCVMPAFSSGQWAGTLPDTLKAVPSGDLLFLCGGGILAHPMGVAAGVTSIRQAWQAVRDGRPVDDAARDAAELRAALSFFGGRN